MKVDIYKKGKIIEARSTGCNRCSHEWVIDEETSTNNRQVIMDEILDELKENLNGLKHACDVLGIDMDTLK
mgnify:CR=1 FL=1